MDAASLIAKFEGYASKAYWDRKQYSIGYGSSTEGPAQFHVTKGMTTTRDRALQNLEVRVPEFATIAERACGQAVWLGLTEDQRSALTSITYNYGRLPVHVDPADPAGTAARIKARGADNGGINRKRRAQEANFYLTGTITGGKPSGTASAVIVGTAATVGAQQAAAGNMNVAIVATLLAVFLALVKTMVHFGTPGPQIPQPSALDVALADLETKHAAYEASKLRAHELAPEIKNAISALESKLKLIEE